MSTTVASEVDMAAAGKVLTEMGKVGAGDLIPLLQKLQKVYGYLPPLMLTWVSEQTGLPASPI